MAIIGISGKIGSGKDLTASIIQYWLWKSKVESAKDMSIHYTYKDFISNKSLSDTLSGWKTVKFADKLKDIVCILLGCTREQLEDREFKETELGDEWTRYCLENSYGSFMSIEIPDIEGTFGKEDYFFTDIRSSRDYWEKYLEGSKNHLGIQFIREFKLTPRLLLQKIGTDLFRYQIHSNIWVNATMSDYKQTNSCSHWEGDVPIYRMPNWIITDVRFPNEAKAVKDKDGIMVRIERDSYKEFTYSDEQVYNKLVDMGFNFEPIEKDSSWYEHAINEGFKFSECLQKWSFDEDNYQEHESETALDDYEFDYIIDNNSTIEDLAVKVKAIFKEVKK